MADPVSLIVIAVIIVSVIALAWYTSRRTWNVDREDDEVREEHAQPLLWEDEEEG